MLPPDIAPWPERLLREFGRRRKKEHEARRFATRFYRPVPALKRLKDSAKGKRCFIIGNGPSLNKLDINLLKDEITFGVNGIFLKFDEMCFRPTYYVVEDALVAHDRAPEINKLRGMHKIFAKSLAGVLTPDEDTTYANVVYDYSSYADFPEFSLDAARCVWVGGTVTYLNLQYAFYLGCDPVYLIGIDHNYAVHVDQNEVSGKELTSLGDDPNHFHPDYFGKGYRWHDPNVARMEKAYVKARKVFEQHGRRIFNATVGGKLEVFERVSYESLFP